MTKPAILALQDGTIFHGIAIGASGLTQGEVVFNTSMTGYQEILTDPSYARQIITLTYPHIGNTGTNKEDEEATEIHASGLVIRDLPLLASNWRNQMPLQDYLANNNVVAIAEIDTRQLTRILREQGAQNGAIMAGDDIDEARALAAAQQFPGLAGMDLAKEVTTAQPYEWTLSVWQLGSGYQQAADLSWHVVAYDYGIKKNILCMLAERGARVTVVPAQTPAAEVLALNPDGVFLSNGPGDPEPCDYAIEAIQQILDTDIPVFGICLGHQLLSLASGAQTLKMKFGHHGANHPVQDLASGEVMISSQNHGFAVDEASLPANLKATHRSLFDGSLQAVHRTDKPAFSFQGHPEASPGPHDVAPLFDHFFELIEQRQRGGGCLMPRRHDIESILIIGAGPIIIGQACEFDYSGAQACKALKEEGFRVILINSNPATIMTDPDTADSVYIEPIHWTAVAKIIEKEKPDALLPTMGGQTALNCALDLVREGVLKQHGVEMIGASREAIDMAEDRDQFRQAMAEIGLHTPQSFIAHSLEEAWQGQAQIGFPVIIRPSFTMGGSGGGIAYNKEEFEDIIKRGLDLSPTTEVLVEKSVLGWKEYEMEVVRDKKDNCIIICSIENLDPMGVHTGDSITVAPAQTLTDKEYQIMRDASLAVLRKIGVETGGSNVQFAIDPDNGEMIIIEMNPRVSRSSALASKATGFPIAKVAAKLAAGYTLDELQNDITGGATPASFEPSIDYVVTKVPRFTFEKFPQADDRLGTQMKSVGEVMAIGRSFQESFQKALRGLEIGSDGLDEIVDQQALSAEQKEELYRTELRLPGAQRIWYVADAFRSGYSLEQIFQLTAIDPWFLVQIEELVAIEGSLSGRDVGSLTAGEFFQLKRKGFSDRRLAKLLASDELSVAAHRRGLNVRPVYKRVDTCAAEFASSTAYLYSSYEMECEANTSDRAKIVVLGGGPNRIGQGIEFDYCCVHAAMAMREDGYETIMVNCNPETVSTDYDTSDRLYFEPLTLEDVLEIIHLEQPRGVIVQFGGQTPLNLARALEAAGVPIIGTTHDSIDLAEDRERFQQMIHKLELRQPPNRISFDVESSPALADEVGFPLVVRPSYVLGGRAMEIVYDQEDLARYMTEAVKVTKDSPVLLDRFLDDAVEVDVDAICDGENVFIGGLMEHIEQAGVHSGDSACSLPPYTLPEPIQQELCRQVEAMARELNVIGLMNTQFAIKGEDVYILEVNPRASRTVPFVSKATGVPLAKVAARCMAGKSLSEQGYRDQVIPDFVAVKESVFPFAKFRGVDPILGPEMKSTGEVMGIGRSFAEAFAKGLLAAGTVLPRKGRAFLSVRDPDKAAVVELARDLIARGFSLVATGGTARAIQQAGIECQHVNKVMEGRPHVVDMIKNEEIDLIVNTTEGRGAIADSFEIRREALMHGISYTTTMNGGFATCIAMDHLDVKEVYRLQSLHS